MEKDLSSSGKLQKRRLETKDCCFLCLAVTDIKIEEEDFSVDVSIKRKVINKETVSLKSIQRYLQINTDALSASSSSKVLASGATSNYNDVSVSGKDQRRNLDEVEVDLCRLCAKIFKNFSNLFASFEKIEMEMHYWLERIQHQISEASKKPELVQTYSKRMTSDAKALAELVLVDKLRKEVLKKVPRRKAGSDAKVNLVRLKNLEKYLRRSKPSTPRHSSHISQTDSQSEVECYDDSFPAADDEDYYDDKHIANVLPVADRISPEFSINSHPSSKTSVASVNLDSRNENNTITVLDGQIQSKLEPSLIIETTGSRKRIQDRHTRKYAYNSKTKKFHCTLCQKTFTTISGAHYHYDSIHLRTVYKCDFCKLLLSNRNNLSRHHETCKSRIQSRFVKGKPNANPGFRHTCPTCGKGFVQRSNMERHQKTVHLKQKNYACDLCEKKFCYSKNLKAHKNQMHCGILFDCKCTKRFGSKDALSLHQKECVKTVKVEPKVDILPN